MDKRKYKNIDDYIASQRVDLREMLEEIRAIIRSVVPSAEEVISYQIPCYKHHGMMVGFGVHKKGCSFYTMSTKILSSFSKELKNFEYSGSTIHFDPQKALPVALIKKITKQRMKENELRTLLKQKAKLKK